MIDVERIARDPQYFKSCCAAFYGSPWARMVFGPSLHPGGLELTEELAKRMALSPNARVLDLASGLGVSAKALTEAFAWRVVGMDYGFANASEATLHGNGMSFLAADAERLPFRAGTFHGVLSECAFCLFPDKERAASEIARVLRHGGVFGLADITLDDDAPLSADLRTALAAVSCIATAQPLWRYQEILARHGLQLRATIDAGFALRDLMESMKRKLEFLPAFFGSKQPIIAGFSFHRIRSLLDEVRDLVDAGDLGYSLILAGKA